MPVAAQYNGRAPGANMACGATVNERGADMEHIDQHFDRPARPGLIALYGPPSDAV